MNSDNLHFSDDPWQIVAPKSTHKMIRQGGMRNKHIARRAGGGVFWLTWTGTLGKGKKESNPNPNPEHAFYIRFCLATVVTRFPCNKLLPISVRAAKEVTS